jgi:hypothetical protein
MARGGERLVQVVAWSCELPDGSRVTGLAVVLIERPPVIETSCEVIDASPSFGSISAPTIESKSLRALRAA